LEKTNDETLRVKICSLRRALVDVLLRERLRSAVPLGDGAFAQLAAPGGPMALLLNPAHLGPRGTRVVALLLSIVDTGTYTWAIWCPGGSRPSHIISAWAVRSPEGTSSGARISTWALRGPGVDPCLASPA